MDQDLRHEDIAPSEGSLISFTDKAVEMLKEAMKREGVQDGGLRVAVVGGGCSGFQYNLSLDDSARPDDEIVTQDGVKAFIDPVSAQYLRGTMLDYVTGLHGAGFKFLNPNATRTCGCGTSFSA